VFHEPLTLENVFMQGRERHVTILLILQVAAMALSPIAAMSLAFVQNADWKQSMHDFVEQLRNRSGVFVDSDGFRDWLKGLDTSLTFMDWTYKLTGVDLTYIWDPELWIKFKDAVWNDNPQIFWNELMDRIEYSECSSYI
jgi:hypothetical protein